MIEVVVLFFIVIVIVLCILSIMYKCTDGSMDPNGFSVDTCFKLGDPKKDDDKTSTKTDESVVYLGRYLALVYQVKRTRSITHPMLIILQ